MSRARERARQLVSTPWWNCLQTPSVRCLGCNLEFETVAKWTAHECDLRAWPH